MGNCQQKVSTCTQTPPQPTLVSRSTQTLVPVAGIVSDAWLARGLLRALKYSRGSNALHESEIFTDGDKVVVLGRGNSVESVPSMLRGDASFVFAHFCQRCRSGADVHTLLRHPLVLKLRIFP